jgi:hypothetical protein
MVQSGGGDRVVGGWVGGWIRLLVSVNSQERFLKDSLFTFLPPLSFTCITFQECYNS